MCKMCESMAYNVVKRVKINDKIPTPNILSKKIVFMLTSQACL